MSVNIATDIKPISYIKTNAAHMMKYVNEQKNSIVITQNGEARAVLIDIETYQSMQKAFNILRLIQLSEKDVEQKRYKDSTLIFDSLKQKYST